MKQPKKQLAPKLCDNCGNEYQIKTRYDYPKLRWGMKHYCSPECQYERQAINREFTDSEPEPSFTFAFCQYRFCRKLHGKYLAGTGVQHGDRSFCSGRCKEDCLSEENGVVL